MKATSMRTRTSRLVSVSIGRTLRIAASAVSAAVDSALCPCRSVVPGAGPGVDAHIGFNPYSVLR